MPIGFTSAARNLFLLGSAGADLVTNFFKTIDQSSTTDGVFTARDIKYLYSEERYLLAGLALNSQGKSFGFHEKRQEDGTEDWSVKTQSTDPTNNVTLTSLELDSNGNLLVGGLANNAPWIARYTTAGVLKSGPVQPILVTEDTLVLLLTQMIIIMEQVELKETIH